MLAPDVMELKEFYESALGRTVAGLLAARIRDWWPEAPGDVTVGMGFATPYLLPFMERTELTAALMPAVQGAAYWPVGRPNLTLLADETDIPFVDNCVNRVLMVHMVENSEHLRRMLQEVWRVLTPGGRVLAIVPNRRGIWARAPKSPFAYGQPFSQRQLRGVFADTGFTGLRSCNALYIPPVPRRIVLKSAHWVEVISSFLFPLFGGVILLEAEKQIYATSRDKVKVARMGRLYVKPVGAMAGRSYFRSRLNRNGQP